MSEPNKPILQQYPVVFTLVDHDNQHCVPTKIDKSMYYLNAPKDIPINFKGERIVDMGIIFTMPEIVTVFLKEIGVSIPMVLHMHLDSVYDTLVNKGIELVSPKIISPNYAPKELRICIKNIGEDRITIKAGEPLVCAYFTTSAPIALGLKTI